MCFVSKKNLTCILYEQKPFLKLRRLGNFVVFWVFEVQNVFVFFFHEKLNNLPERFCIPREEGYQGKRLRNLRD